MEYLDVGLVYAGIPFSIFLANTIGYICTKKGLENGTDTPESIKDYSAYRDFPSFMRSACFIANEAGSRLALRTYEREHKSSPSGQ